MTLRLPILYSFRRCPYAMRARMAIYSAKIPHEHREVDLKNKPAEMLELSPKGTVPVLFLPDGRVLEESLDIMVWALNYFSLSTQEQDLITQNDTSFKKALDRYKYPGRYQEERESNYRELCMVFVEKLERLLNPYLGGEKPTLAGMAIFPFIRQFSCVDSDWFEAQPYPRLKKWLNDFLSSELYQEVMEKHPLWIAGNVGSHISF